METTFTTTTHPFLEVRLQLPRIKCPSTNTMTIFGAPSEKSSQSTRCSRAPIKVSSCCQKAAPRTFSGWCAFSPQSLGQRCISPCSSGRPIPFHVENYATGLRGDQLRFSYDGDYGLRDELDSERQRNETEEQRKAREASNFSLPT